MGHDHSLVDFDSRFIIDPVTRGITTNSKKLKLIKDDHNFEKFTFEIPRYIDNHDMSLCNDIKINYENISSANRTDVSTGPYQVLDAKVDPIDDDKVVFTWLLSGKTAKYAGTLQFSIRFRCINGGIVDYSWGTDVFKNVTVVDTVNNSGEAVVETYTDVLVQWEERLFGEGGATSVYGEHPVKLIESLDTENIMSLRDIESGSYVLKGYFTPYAGCDSTMTFGSSLVVNISKRSDASYVQVFYPYNNCVQYIKATDSSYEQNNVYLNDLSTGGGSSNELTDTVTGKKYKLEVADGKLTMTEVGT